MSYEALIALTAFAFVSSITPGPNNLMLLASGANFGFARSIPHLLGVSVGFTAMIWVVGTCLERLFSAFPASYTILKVFSIIYLIYLAFKIATSAAPPDGSTQNTSKATPFSFAQAALFQWVNPKAWTMALTACATYVPTQDPRRGLVAVAGIFGIINLPSVATWTLLGVQMRRFMQDRRRLAIFNRCAAVLLLASLYPVIFGHDK